MSDTLQVTEEKIDETPIEDPTRVQGKDTDPDPYCCRAPGDPDGGPDT